MSYTSLHNTSLESLDVHLHERKGSGDESPDLPSLSDNRSRTRHDEIYRRIVVAGMGLIGCLLIANIVVLSCHRGGSAVCSTVSSLPFPNSSLSTNLKSSADSTVHRSYIKDRRYMTLDHKYDHLWNEWGELTQILISPSEAAARSEAVNADKAQQPDESFTTEKHDDERMPAAISMYHQMHCLSSLRMALQMAYYTSDRPALDWHENEHWPHCLDYLRSTILCFADDTVEMPIRLENGTRIPFIDGVQETRMCRNRNRIDGMLDLWGYDQLEDLSKTV